MTPVHANSLERIKPARRLRRVATKTALILMPITFGAACLVATSWGVTQFLAGEFELQSAGISEPTFAGASPPQVPGAAVLPAAEMPEIKNGVPELVPIRASALATNALTGPVGRADNLLVQTKVATVSQPSAASSTGPEASHAQNSSALPVDQEEPVTFARHPVTSAPAVPDGTPEDRAVTRGSSEANADDAPSLPQVASTTPSPQPPTVTHADRKPNAAEKRSAAAKADSSPARADREERRAAKKAKRVVQAPRTDDAKRPVRAVAQPSSSEKAATSRSKAPSKRGNDKPATAQRTRVAAAQPTTSAASSPTAAAAPVVNEERLHLLGIPLPTGRKVRECLLEWRC